MTSQPISEVVYGTLSKTITWDVAGTNAAPINVANVKISLVGSNGSTVIAESTPNDGTWTGAWPDVALTNARVKVEAVGNVFFDVSDADLTSVKAPTLPVGGNGPGHAVSLTLGTPAAFGAFTPGVQRDYDATSTANVISTAGDAALSVSDPSTNARASSSTAPS